MMDLWSSETSWSATEVNYRALLKMEFIPDDITVLFNTVLLILSKESRSIAVPQRVSDYGESSI